MPALRVHVAPRLLHSFFFLSFILFRFYIVSFAAVPSRPVQFAAGVQFTNCVLPASIRDGAMLPPGRARMRSIARRVGWRFAPGGRPTNTHTRRRAAAKLLPAS